MNLDYVEELSDGDAEKLKRIIESAKNSFQSFLATYKNSVETKNYTVFRESVHKVKSIASVLDIHELLEELEVSNQSFINKEDISPSKIQIENMISEIITTLDRYIQ